MNDPAASSGVSSSLVGRHSVLDGACPVLDTGESSRTFWIPAGVYPPQAGRYDEFAASRGEWTPSDSKKVQEEVDTKRQLDYIAK